MHLNECHVNIVVGQTGVVCLGVAILRFRTAVVGRRSTRSGRRRFMYVSISFEYDCLSIIRPGSPVEAACRTTKSSTGFSVWCVRYTQKRTYGDALVFIYTGTFTRRRVAEKSGVQYARTNCPAGVTDDDVGRSGRASWPFSRTRVKTTYWPIDRFLSPTPTVCPDMYRRPGTGRAE